jgi:hypothetical protein
MAARRNPFDGRHDAQTMREPARSPAQRDAPREPAAGTGTPAAKRARKRRPRFVL